MREDQLRELAATGAGSRFDHEQAQADVANLQAQLAAATASEAQVREKLAAKTEAGDQDEIANVKAQIARAEAQLADAQWRLEQTVYRAPTNGTVVSLALRPGAMAVPLPLTPAMSFVEDEQWVMAIFKQNEVRRVKPGQEAEIAMQDVPGPRHQVQGRLDHVGDRAGTATHRRREHRRGRRADSAQQPRGAPAAGPRATRNCSSPRARRERGAIYTDSGEPIHILRKVIIRVGAKIDWLILKLH